MECIYVPYILKKKKQQQQQICCREQFLQLFINPTHQLVCNQYTILLCKGVGTCLCLYSLLYTFSPGV